MSFLRLCGGGGGGGEKSQARVSNIEFLVIDHNNPCISRLCIFHCKDGGGEARGSGSLLS